LRVLQELLQEHIPSIAEPSENDPPAHITHEFPDLGEPVREFMRTEKGDDVQPNVAIGSTAYDLRKSKGNPRKFSCPAKRKIKVL
jgi:hypothetical protein